MVDNINNVPDGNDGTAKTLAIVGIIIALFVLLWVFVINNNPDDDTNRDQPIQQINETTPETTEDINLDNSPTDTNETNETTETDDTTNDTDEGADTTNP